MTIETPARSIIGIQMLRAIAATMVVFVHFDTELERLHYPILGAGWLNTGVDIFFVISGFIMWTSVERRPGMSATQFLKNRIIRIVPLYWLMTAFVLIVALMAPHAVRTTQVRAYHVIASFLFLPARHPTTGLFWPLVIPGWSLNYEMLFYVVFALAIAFSDGLAKRRFALITGMLIAVIIVAQALAPAIDVMHFYANPIMLEFLMGVIVAVVWSTGRIRRSYGFLVLIAAGFGVLWVANHMHVLFVTNYLGALLVVAGTVFLPPLPANPVSRLGDASYSLYLTHTVVLAAIARICEIAAVRPPLPLLIISGLVSAFAVAFLMYNYFEVRATAALKDRFSGPPAAKLAT